jgi:Methyltransferase domain
MTLKGKINSLRRHPTILKDILQAKNPEEIRDKIKRLDQRRTKMQDEKEVRNFISYLKKGNNYSIDANNEQALNRLCCIEDWENSEFKRIIYELQNASLASYVHRKDWTIPTDNKIISMRKPGFIHRKDWEWALGIIAMRRFDKLNKNNVAIGIGVGREEVLFYLANELKHVYATDIYDGKQWENFAPVDFPENPRKYAPFPYKEDTLTVLRMDGTKIEFPSESFDIAFSFSSIEHFDAEKNHEGAVKSMREIERILKKEGIAVIATE